MANSNDADILAEMEAQFKTEELSPYMDDVIFEKFHGLRDRIEDVEGLIDYKKSFMRDHTSRIAELNVFIKSLESMLRFALDERKELDQGNARILRELRPDEATLAGLQREFARLVAELQSLRNLEIGRELTDLATMDAVWRKAAKKYQFEGAYSLSASKRAILGDEPGLGKTIQSIMTIDMLKGLGECKKVLIICPKPVLDGFQREFSRWSPKQMVFVLNKIEKDLKTEALTLMAMMSEGVLLTNYEVWRRDRTIIDKLIACQFDTVILDEAHNLKNFNSKTMQDVKSIVHAENKCFACGALTFGAGCPRCGVYPSTAFQNWSVKNVFPLTGTAMLNRPQDLLSLLNLLDPTAFPSEDKFLGDFCVQRCAGCSRTPYRGCWCDENPRWRWTFRDGGEALLLKKLGMKYVARKREHVLKDLPVQAVKDHYLEFDGVNFKKQAKFVQKLKEDMRIAFDDEKMGEITQIEILGWLTRIRQSIEWADAIKIYRKEENPLTGKMVNTDEIIWPSGPEDLPSESILMDWAEGLVDEALEINQRVVIFSKFKESLKELERRLLAKGISLVRYDGDLSDSRRIEAQHDFDLTLTRPEDSKFKVMLAHYDSAGAGLNLHGAHQVIFMGREWNPGKEKQAKDRLLRMNSEFKSIVHIPHVEGSATELMDALIAEKEAMIGGFEEENEVNLRQQMKKWLDDK